VARKSSKHPTELELQILQVLWRDGESPGTAIRTALETDRPLTYQSVMTMLGIMEDKGFVKRRKLGGQFRYRARVTEQATAKRMLRDVVDRLFGGSAAVAMTNLLETSDLTDEELDQLRQQVMQSRKGGKS